jgi:ankyrin repeat protein
MAARAGKGCAPFDSWSSVSAPCRNTALHGASSNGHTESVKALLEKGADVNAASNAKCAFTCCLCWMGDGCTRRQGCTPFDLSLSVSAPCRNTALHLASRNGHTESVKALLEKGADVNAENRFKYAFTCCLCWMGDGCTRRQLSAPFDSWWSVSAPCRNMALDLASRNGHTESVKALLEKGADVNAENEDKCAFFLVRWERAACAGKAVRRSTRG